MTRKLLIIALLVSVTSLFASQAEAAPRVINKTSNSVTIFQGSSKSFSGVLVSLHGGGWVGYRDPDQVAKQMSAFVQPALNENWLVVHLAYSTSVTRALADITRLSRQLRRKYPGKPLCLLGNSAGAHLALTYAGLRGKPSPDCVIANGAPTDIPAFAKAVNKKSAARQDNLNRFLEIGFRNKLEMRRYSPLRNLRYFNSQLALFAARRDPIVPFTHSLNFSFKLLNIKPRLYNRVKILSPGAIPFVHAPVSAVAWMTYLNGVTAILRRQK